MADVVGTAAAAWSLVQGIRVMIKHLKGIVQSSKEAQQVYNELHTASTIVESLQAVAQQRDISPNFRRTWDASTLLVIDNFEATLRNLESRLDAGAASGARLRLTFVRRVKWTLSSDETDSLLHQLRGYMTMLGLSQNALLQADLHELLRSVNQIRDTLSQDSRYPLSSEASARLHPESMASMLTPAEIVQDDEGDAEDVRSTRPRRNLRLDSFGQQSRQSQPLPSPRSTLAQGSVHSATPSRPPPEAAQASACDYHHVKVLVDGFMVPDPDYKRSERIINLGLGLVHFTFQAESPSLISMKFIPESAPTSVHEFEISHNTTFSLVSKTWIIYTGNETKLSLFSSQPRAFDASYKQVDQWHKELEKAHKKNKKERDLAEKKRIYAQRNAAYERNPHRHSVGSSLRSA